MFSPESTKLALDILHKRKFRLPYGSCMCNNNLDLPRTCCRSSVRCIARSRRKGRNTAITKSILSVLSAVINLLRSIPFLILMIMVSVTRFFAHTVVGDSTDYSTTVFAAFPFVARLVEQPQRVDVIS